MIHRKATYHSLLSIISACLLCLSAAASPLREYADTTEKVSLIRFGTRDSAQAYARFLLGNHPVFMDHWSNESAFVYDDIRLENLDEEINLLLLGENEQFKLTWYGRLTSTYKRRWGKQHHGLDIDLETGDTVMAAFDGVVRYAQFNRSGFGNCIIIRHMNGLETIYAHLSKIDVEPNVFVSAGQLIGLGGNTGHSTGSHLHFETRYKDFSFNPLLFIDIEKQELKSNTLVLHASDFAAYKKKNKEKKLVIAEAATTNKTDSVASIQSSTESIEPEMDYCLVPEAWLDLIEEKNETATVLKTAKSHAASTKKAITPHSKKSGKTYIIKSGDNLGFISQKTGVSVSQLRKLNVIKSDRKLMPGQVLKLN
jgi:murein DD-endopeptidase MepM/ murein hydrolase activator NlpD